MCHIEGLDAFTDDRVDRLAAAGYVAVAPGLFHYTAWVEECGQRRATLRDMRIVDDITATTGHARACEAVADAGVAPVAIVGHCMGGRSAMLGAGNVPEIGLLVICYGGQTMPSWGVGLQTPFERIVHIAGPVQGIFGLDDEELSPVDVDRIDAEFRKHGIDCEFHRYESAGHALQNFLSPERERLRKEAAEDSRQRTLGFVARSFA